MRRRFSKKRKARETKEGERMVHLSPEEYADLINQLEFFKKKTRDFEEANKLRSKGRTNTKLENTIKFKITQFVTRIQNTHSQEELIKNIDRATKDVVQFITNFANMETKDTFEDGVLIISDE